MPKYYVLNHEKQTIIVDTTVKPTAEDKKDVRLYVSMGYKMRKKSQERAKMMRDKADNLSADTIRKALKDDKEGLTKFENIMKGKEEGYKKGFFVARKWYKDNYKK